MCNKVIFCDFDGTITKEDTIDKLLENHAGSNWLAIEKLWLSRQIGSRECLKRQIDCIDYFTAEMLDKFITGIEIDEHFLDFIRHVKRNGIEFYIVSDGFDLLINGILEKYNITDIKIFSNQLKLENNRLIASFPYTKETCEVQAGLCKCDILEQYGKNKEIVYIGDGMSDICASKNADVIFAKGTLAKYCRDNQRNYKPFTDFRIITDELNINILNIKEKQNAVIG